MDQVLNPYAPGAGTQAPWLTGRVHLLVSTFIALSCTLNRRSTQSFVLVGLRGVGKTMFLNRVEDHDCNAGHSRA